MVVGELLVQETSDVTRNHEFLLHHHILMYSLGLKESILRKIIYELDAEENISNCDQIR